MLKTNFSIQLFNFLNNFFHCCFLNFYSKVCLIFFGLASRMQNLCSPTRDRTHAPCSGNTESEPPDHQGRPQIFFIKKERKKVKSLSHVQLFATPWTVAHQAPPSMGFSRQEYWSGLPFPSPGDLPDPGIKPGSPSLQADALTSEPPGKPTFKYVRFI